MSVLVWLALVVACSVAPVPPVVPVQVAPVLEGTVVPMDGFAGIEVGFTSGFAHDVGVETQITGATLDGVKVPYGEVLSGWVAKNGWTDTGDRSDAAVLRVTTAFVKEWSEVGGDELLSSPRAGIGQALERSSLTFHPLRAEVREAGGKRWAVLTAYTYDYTRDVSHYTRHAWAFSMTDGSVPGPEVAGLPERISFSDLDPPGFGEPSKLVVP